jgi:hypothetical protein
MAKKLDGEMVDLVSVIKDVYSEWWVCFEIYGHKMSALQVSLLGEAGLWVDPGNGLPTQLVTSQAEVVKFVRTHVNCGLRNDDTIWFDFQKAIWKSIFFSDSLKIFGKTELVKGNRASVRYSLNDYLIQFYVFVEGGLEEEAWNLEMRAKTAIPTLVSEGVGVYGALRAIDPDEVDYFKDEAAVKAWVTGLVALMDADFS